MVPVLAHFSRLDPDVHHDGIMFTQALAVSEGLIPNKEVFAYYGPGSALIHGLMLSILGNQILVLRLFTALIIMITAHILYNLLNLSLRPFMSLGLVLSWAMGLASNFPWSSAITTLLILASSYLIVRSSGNRKNEAILISVAGILISLGTYVRIHLLIISVVVGFWCLLIEKRPRFLKIWIWSTLGTHLAVFILMILTGSWSGFLSDSIAYPSSVRVLTHYPKSYLIGTLWYPVIWIFLIAGVLYFQKLLGSKNGPILNRILAGTSATIFLGLVLFFYDLPRVGNVTYLNPRIVLTDGSWLLLCGTGYVALMFVIGMCFKLRTITTEGVNQNNFRLLIPIAIGSATQLYPLYDRFHLWYLAPIFILAAVLNFDLLKINPSNYTLGLASILSILLVFQSAAIIQNFRIDRVASKSHVLGGMLMSSKKQHQIDNAVKFIGEFAIYRETNFDCANGFFAGSTGRYLPNGSNFVNWGPKNTEAKMSAQIIILCKSTQERMQKYLNEGWQLLDQQKWSSPDRALPPLYNYALKKQKVMVD
jgi:hypothetical protein